MLNGVNRTTRITFGLAAVTLAALCLRMIGLGEVPPRWDEGWTIAHAALPLRDMLTITSADVHPPLFYMLLGLWQQVVGINLFAARYLAVLVSLPAVPLAYAAATAWNPAGDARTARLAFIAAVAMAWLPLAVYYSAVVRMYALVPTFILLATWAELRLLAAQRRHTIWLMVAFIIGATGAMMALYHAAWALIALGMCGLALALQRRRLRVFLVSVGVSLALYLPWAVYAIPQLLGRAEAGTHNTAQQVPVSQFLRLGVEALALAQATKGWGVPTVTGILAVGLAAALFNAWRPRRKSGVATESAMAGIASQLAALLLPILMIAMTLLGVAAAARNWTFNARMVIGATPALALMLAWALDQLLHRSRILAAGLAAFLAVVYAGTSTVFVYQKTLEVFDPYNPHTYYQHIAPAARPDDIVFFNVLSPAGFYALDRKATDPAWSYALTWDPVIEPRERWEQRIRLAAASHARIWVVLYRGLAGRNGDLRGWLDTNLYPASAQWGEEGVFYGLYGTADERLSPAAATNVHWRAAGGFDLELRSAELPATARSGAIIPVGLTWRAVVPLRQNYKVFVHAFDDHGELVSQHDALPLNDLRPMPSLPPGADVIDHHGLALPVSFSGRLRIVVGLYDPATSQRVLTAGGKQSIELGSVAVSVAP